MGVDDRAAAGSARERFVDVERGALLTREIGAGPPVVVIHGGPGMLDHTFLLPDMDRLADLCRLVYYDQRGHGGFRGDLDPADVTMERFMQDLEAVCDAYGLAETSLLGHSWGAQLAMRFAIRRPERVRGLMLMNAAPASSTDHRRFLEFRRELLGPAELAEVKTAMATPEYEQGDPDAVAEALRLVFRAGIVRPADLHRLRLEVTRENALRGHAIEMRFAETLYAHDFDLLPELERLDVPSLIIHGDHDFVPLEAAEHVAAALRGARLVVLAKCGHFAYLEAPDAVHAEVAAFLRGRRD